MILIDAMFSFNYILFLYQMYLLIFREFLYSKLNNVCVCVLLAYSSFFVSKGLNLCYHKESSILSPQS